MTTKQAALKYLISMAWSVFPVGIDKKPLIEWAEYQERLPEVDEVNEWWDKWPEAGIGVVTGEISNLTVIDVDRINHDPNQPLAEHSDLPETLIAQTGSGGKHYYYTYNPKADHRKTLRKDIDIKSWHGYVIAPPSNHISGNKYNWLTKVKPVALPDLFFSWPVGTPRVVFSHGVEAGSRNNSAASMAGLCVKNKFTPQETFDFLNAWNSQNKPPLPMSELRQVIESIYKTDARNHPDDIEIVSLKKAAEADKSEDTTRIPTGFDFIDESSRGGFGRGELWIISAMQGQGKTTLAMEMTLKMVEQGKKALWLTYELLEKELWEKFKEMGAPDEFGTFTTLKRVKGDIQVIEKIITKAVAQENTRVVFIDHFGRLCGKVDKYDSNISQNFALYLALLAARLKELSLEKEVTIVLMAHTKKPERGRKQTTSDIANTSGLGNEATVSILLEREVNDFAADSDSDKYTNKLFVKIDKSRWGREVNKLMKFEGGRISKWDTVEDIINNSDF